MFLKRKKEALKILGPNVMILTFHFIILKHVNRYRIFHNNKNTDKLSQNNVVYFKGVTFVSVLIKRLLTCIY